MRPFKKQLRCSGDCVMLSGLTGPWSVIYCDSQLQIILSKRNFAQHKWLKRLVCLKAEGSWEHKTCFFLKPSTLWIISRNRQKTRHQRSRRITTTTSETYWVLVGDGTCWRNPVQAAEMWRVTLEVKWQAEWSDSAETHTLHRHMRIQLLKGGISGHKLAVNHTLMFLTRRHAITFSHAASHHSGLTASRKEWRLCFTDWLTHLVKMGGRDSACFKLCTTPCRKTWVNTVMFF